MCSAMFWLTVLLPVIYSSCSSAAKVLKTEEEEARSYLASLNVKAGKRIYEKTLANFNYLSDATEANHENMIIADDLPDLDQDLAHFNWDSFKDTSLKRQAKFYSLLNAYIDPDLMSSYLNNIEQMNNVTTGDINMCLYRKPNECGEQVWPFVHDALENSHDPEEMKYYWERYYEGGTRTVRPLFKDCVELDNIMANVKNYSNTAEDWMDEYEDPPVDKFENFILDLFEQIRPIYLQFYSFVRTRYRGRFGEKAVPKRKPIPVHLFSNFYEDPLEFGIHYLKPYPGKGNIESLLNLEEKQSYSVLKIMQSIEDYYTSMGLELLPVDFWKNSIFGPTNKKQITDRQTTFDFGNKKFYRIITTGEISYDSIMSYVQDMGQLHYALAYRDQPCCFRKPPTLVYGRAVSNTMVELFLSFKHLQKLGVLNENELDPHVEINYLFFEFVKSVGSVVLSLVNDIWRWRIFRNQITEANYNQAFWDLRLKYQGVVPPSKRSEEYLDAARSKTVVDDIQTLGDFLEPIIKYKHIEALCTAAGEFNPKNPDANPLHKCDLYGSKKAGKIWNDMLKLGASKPWTSSLKAVTGTSKLDAKSLLTYFEPLHKWLKDENDRHEEFIGWEVA